jgi:CRISPR-associated endoribonuclease Cas6
MRDSFRIARFRFDLEAVDALHMPAYQGSTFRGGFGYAFKKMVCFQPNWGACTPCRRSNDCPYGYIFETTAPAGLIAPLDLHEITPPFVIEAPAEARRIYQPGERLGFDLLLVGRAIAYLPYFLMAFQELGRVGIGNPAGRYVLQRISAIHPWRAEQAVVFDGVDVQIGGRDLSASWDDVAAWARELPTDQLTLRFLTPTRVKYQNGYVTRPAFHVLLRSLLRRISALAFFHCDTAWDGDARALIAAAEPIITAQASTEWADWDRYSGRQRQRVPLGGFVGAITYQGQLAPFHTLLALGALVHVGKATVFGHGRYLIE